MQTSQEVHVSKDHDTSEGFQSVFRIDGRGPTNIGGQGHHISAYALFKILVHELTSSDIEEAIIRLSYFVTELLPEEDSLSLKVINSVQSLGNKLITPQEAIQAATNFNKEEAQQKISNALAIANLSYLDQLACELAELYLSVRNRQDFVSFPPKGNRNPPPGEGSRIKTAISNLKNYSQQIQSSTDHDDVKVDPDIVSKIAASMFQLFWYPKLKEEELFTLDSQNKIDEWKTYCRKQGYKIDSKPRTNDLEILYIVTKNHIDMILSCFPELRRKQTEIISAFARLVAQTGIIENQHCHWEMNEQKCQEFINMIIIQSDEQISSDSEASLESEYSPIEHIEYDHIISDTSISEHESDSSYDKKTPAKKPRINLTGGR